jgi:hypothetical protein
VSYKVVRDASGKVVCFGPNDGMYEPTIKDGNTLTIETLQPVIIPTYAELRSLAYPSIQDQLDMQYWDSVNGTTTWKDAIEAVKTENPKP